MFKKKGVNYKNVGFIDRLINKLRGSSKIN